MKVILFCNCCALLLFSQAPALADEGRCSSDQIARMRSVLTTEEVDRLCDLSPPGATDRHERRFVYDHAGEPIPRINWGALEDYFDIATGSPRIGSNSYRPEMEITNNAIEFDVRATVKMGFLGRLMLPHWRACFYDRENVPMETKKVQFEPSYLTSGWTTGMRGKGYIALPEHYNLSDVGVIRIKRLPCG